MKRLQTRQQDRQTSADFLFKRPIAHRGLWNSALPENSLAAFENAAVNGYPIELDVRLSSDGGIVVFHDDDLKRMTGQEGKPESLTLAGLCGLRLVKSQQAVPSLEQVLHVVSGRVPLLIEIKTDNNTKKIVQALIRQMQDYKGLYAVQSFNPFAMLHYKRLDPKVPRGQLAKLRYDDMIRPKQFLLRRMAFNFVTKVHFISYNAEDLPSGFVSRAREKGQKALAWTITAPSQQRNALYYADNIIFEGFDPQ